MRVKARAAASRNASRRTKRPGRAKRSTGISWFTRPVAVGVGLILVIAAAALMAGRQPSHREGVTDGESSYTINRPEPPQMLTTPVDTRGAVVMTVATAAKDRAHVGSAPAPGATPIEPAKAGATPTTLSASAAPAADAGSASDPSSTTEVQKVSSVAVSGCVEQDDEAFWLRDTSGTDAPKARSWKSGFLRKRSASLELVDPSRTLRLERYVGQRVVATGTIANREMRARSLQRVATSCS